MGPAIGPYLELGLTYNDINNCWAGAYAGLAIGCYLFIPYIYKFGRRPVYITSTLVQFASAIWAAKATTPGQVLGFNIVQGLGGALSETVVQITIADLFFIHQRATMNGIFLLMQSIGSFLAPVAAGYVIVSQGWQWIWWWSAIFLGINLILIVFLFEETKWSPTIAGQSLTNQAEAEVQGKVSAEVHQVQSNVETRFKKNGYRQRMALISPTPTPILQHYVSPIVVLCTIPAVTYCAITYGTLLAWITAMGSVQAYYLLEPPYNFDAAGIGLFSLSAFVGLIIGVIIGGPLNDWFVLWVSRRNKGVFEPEFRLWLALPCAIICPAGLLLYGFALARVRMPLSVSVIYIQRVSDSRSFGHG